MSQRTLLFCSALALQRPFLRVAEILAREHGLQGHVIAPEEFAVPRVQEPSGTLSRRAFDASSTDLTVHFLAAGRGDVERVGFWPEALTELLATLEPDYVWLHAEFWEGIARQFLWHFRFRRRPRIAAYVAVDHVSEAPPLVGLRWPPVSRDGLMRMLLWRRLDGVCACSRLAQEAARRAGLPRRVPVVVNGLPTLGPEEASREAAPPPWRKDGRFTVGFAGALNGQKGWKVLLRALGRLPDAFQAVLVGDGAQWQQARAWAAGGELAGRVHLTGAIPREELLALYASFDAFVLPSVTRPGAVEQFGCVLAEAMACGVPVVGSSSGAIPETIGEAGLVVPEGDPEALAGAISRIRAQEGLRKRLARAGRQRWERNYSCRAYARSLARLLGLRGEEVPQR
jgi:glycosyltransferase involved in cell wall biosynthesis